MKVTRLRKIRDFEDVFKSGIELRGKVFSLHTLRGAGCNTAAVGASIAKKFAPKAVKRNYIRRAIHAAFRDREGSLQPDMKVVVRLIRDIKHEKKKELSKIARKDLEGLLGRIGKVR